MPTPPTPPTPASPFEHPRRVADRRAEAHLWLVMEEALATARAGGEAVTEARRTYASVADALVVSGAIEAERAADIVREFDDVLAVRGFVGPNAFAGRASTPWDPERRVVARSAEGWLEAAIEHHLDLIVDLDPLAGHGVGRRTLELLRPQVRALEAAGSVRRGQARLADLAATLDAAGYAVDGPLGEVDRGWLTFLRDRPQALLSSHEAATHVEVRAPIGEVGGETVVVVGVGWSEALLQIDVEAPSPSEHLTVATMWHCSVFDDRGHLHLGASGARVHEHGEAPLQFRLRPGLMAGVQRLTVRITRGAERIEDEVSL